MIISESDGLSDLQAIHILCVDIYWQNADRMVFPIFNLNCIVAFKVQEGRIFGGL